MKNIVQKCLQNEIFLSNNEKIGILLNDKLTKKENGLLDKKVNCQKICAALLSHNRHRACKWPIVQEIHLARSSSRSVILGIFTPSAGRPTALDEGRRPEGSSLFGMGELWIGNSLYLFASVVNRYSLTQPQRHRGTEAITAAWPYPYNSAKSHQAQLALDAAE
ncbi:hypothetical protein [Methanothrix sp.]